MKKSPKLYQMVGLALVAIGVFMFGGLSMAATVQNNNVSTHTDLSAADTDACTTCHPRSGTALSDASLQYTNDFHNTHRNSIHLEGAIDDCSFCHKAVSVDDKISATMADSSSSFGVSNRATDGGSHQGDQSGSITTADTYDYAGLQNGNPARKYVSSVICNRCHGKFQSSAHSGINYVNTNRYGCTTCHKTGGSGRLAYDAHTDAGAIGTNGWISTATASNKYFCWICHGGRDKFQTEESNVYDGGGNAEDEWKLNP